MPSFQISSNIIEDEPDHFDEPVVDNNSTLELVCVAPQFSNVIKSFSVQVEEREKDSSIKKDVDNDSTETETNEGNNN